MNKVLLIALFAIASLQMAKVASANAVWGSIDGGDDFPQAVAQTR